MQGPPPDPPESIVLQSFGGIKNTVAPERLSGSELERALNIDLDDAGQPRRRRGFVRRSVGVFHSIRELGGKVYGVKDGSLGIIRPDFSFQVLQAVGPQAVCYAMVGDDVFFSCASASGVISQDEFVSPWGATDGQGQWLSPVINPTTTLGEISGKLLGDPPLATSIEAYSGRMYLAVGKTLWATELFQYHYVDRTRNFMQFEDDITLVMAVDDGLFVGTTGGLYFLQGTLGKFRLSQISDAAVLAGSGVRAPAEMVHPQARNGPVPVGQAVIMMTDDGVVAGFTGGTAYNLTEGTVVFPEAISAAAMFRQDAGMNHYVAATDSAGGPSANSRIGDYVDAEIVRAFDRVQGIAETLGVGDSVSAMVRPQGLLLDADFANGIYMLNGATATLDEILDLAASYTFTTAGGIVPLSITPGVGLRATKSLNSGNDQASQIVFMNASLLPVLNTAGGFTAVSDQVWDQMAGGVDAVANAASQFQFTNPDFAPYLGSKFNYGGPSATVPENNDGLFIVAAEHDNAVYDYQVGQTNEIVGPALEAPLTIYQTIGRKVLSYYGEAPTVVVSVDQNGAVGATIIDGTVIDVPLPDAAITQAYFTVGVFPHHGTVMDKDAVSARATCSRLRIYTPAQPAGWIAPE